MSENQPNPQKNDAPPGNVARRDFVALSMTAGLAATVGSSAAAIDVVETDVEIKTPDGTCDAAFIHPKTGSHPGVLMWPDAFGLRPAMRDIAKRCLPRCTKRSEPGKEDRDPGLLHGRTAGCEDRRGATASALIFWIWLKGKDKIPSRKVSLSFSRPSSNLRLGFPHTPPCYNSVSDRPHDGSLPAHHGGWLLRVG
jgi:hypothetical protein